MPDSFSLPATADVRHAYGIETRRTTSLTYAQAVDRFDRWLARQTQLAVQDERARAAKDQS